MGSSSKSNSQMVISEINVTPLVDVMLVLLIMFMVTAPLLQQGLEVEVPKTNKAGTFDIAQEPLRIVIDSQKTVKVGKTVIAPKQLRGFLNEVLKHKKDKQVFIEAAQTVDYGFVVRLMAEIKASGATQIGLVTLPDDSPDASF